jgi:hypothetical protein
VVGGFTALLFRRQDRNGGSGWWLLFPAKDHLLKFGYLDRLFVELGLLSSKQLGALLVFCNNFVKGNLEVGVQAFVVPALSQTLGNL